LSQSRKLLDDLQGWGLIEGDEERFRLLPLAKRRLTWQTLSLDFLVGQSICSQREETEHCLAHSYVIRKVIGSGATSVTFLAEESGSHRHRTVKLFLPGAVLFEQLDAALHRLGDIMEGRAVGFPEIFDSGVVHIVFPDGTAQTLACVVLQYINGHARPLVRFLSEHPNLDSTVFERFVDRVAGALTCLETAGLTHGDLHDGNILVTENPGSGDSIDFWVIDFIGVPSFGSEGLEHPSDLESFKQHLLNAAMLATEKYPGFAARHLLGDRVFKVLEGLRSDRYATFQELLEDFRTTSQPVPATYFKAPPRPFDWLRVEWIPSQQWLVKLFSPVPSRFETISRFGNTWISGPRGCGKSHYLRVLAFSPSLYSSQDDDLRKKLEILGHDFRRTFGILFACRLGEFKGFDPEAMNAESFDFETRCYLKHIFVLKIINKALAAIKDGLETVDAQTGGPVLQHPQMLDSLVKFLEERFGSIVILDPRKPLPTFTQCMGVTVARENADVSVWHRPALRTDGLLTETHLDDFFKVLRQVFPDLRESQFFVLVDDVSYGHVHYEAQKILNSLVRSQQANHCFKITFEKYMYTSESADDRATDPRNEVTYVDLGEVSLRAQKDTAFDYGQYMAGVVDLRLRVQGWKHDIRAILGRSQTPDEFLAALSGRRWGNPVQGPPTKSQARYAGWNILCSLAHGSIRTLLEMIEVIFRDAHADASTQSISPEKQDIAIRSYSRRQYRALMLLPGDLSGDLSEEPIGQHLQAIIAGIGQMSAEYLRNYDTTDPRRWYETISLERLDSQKLESRAAYLLRELVKYGLILKEGVTFTRADIGLGTRYDLNKIFAPAFEITYRVRNHLYVGRDRFEELLLRPGQFLRRHREKLESLARNSEEELSQQSLF